MAPLFGPGSFVGYGKLAGHPTAGQTVSAYVPTAGPFHTIFGGGGGAGGDRTLSPAAMMWPLPCGMLISSALFRLSPTMSIAPEGDVNSQSMHQIASTPTSTPTSTPMGTGTE